MNSPAYSRLKTNERRRLLVEKGTQLFTEYSFDELSMAQIAKEAGVSKALLYHYFPSKSEFFMATLTENANDLVRRIEPTSSLPPAQALVQMLTGYIEWIRENRSSYTKLLKSTAAIPEVDQLVSAVRVSTANRIAETLEPSGVLAGKRSTPEADQAKVLAAKGWLWFVDGAVLEWLDSPVLSIEVLVDQLAKTLEGAVSAAGYRFISS